MKYKCELRFLVGTGTVLTAYKVEKDGSTTQLFGQEVSALRTFHMEGENLVLTGLLRFGYAFSCEHGDLVSFEVSAPSFIRARSTKPVDEVAVKHKLFIYDGFLYMSEDIADYEANAFTKKGDYLDKEHPYRFSFRASAYIDCSERFGALGIASHRNVAYLQLYLYSFREAVQKALCPGETPASDEQLQMAARNASNILHAMYTFSEFWEHAKAEEIVELCNRLPAETAVETLTEYLSGKSYTALYDFGKPTADEKKNGGKVESKQLTLEVIKQRLNELAAAGSIEDWHPEEADAKDTLLFYVWDANEDRTVEFYPLEKNGLESLKDRIHISKNIPEEWRPDRDALAEYLWNVCEGTASLPSTNSCWFGMLTKTAAMKTRSVSALRSRLATNMRTTPRWTVKMNSLSHGLREASSSSTAAISMMQRRKLLRKTNRLECPGIWHPTTSWKRRNRQFRCSAT